MLSLTGGASLVLVEAAFAQARAEALVLVVPPVFQIPPGTEATFPIQVRPATAMPKRALILIRGLPSTIALSQGRLFESGVWGIPAGDIDALKISSTSVAVGRSDLTVSLVAMDGTLLAEARSNLAIGAAAVPTVARPDRADTAALRNATPQEQPLRDAAPLVKRLTAEQTEQLLAVVKKGDEQMRVGNVSAARLLYRHAAESGLGAGALALAATYDAQELAKHRVLGGGVQPDPREAQIWYERARDLGSAEARERLLRFGAR